MQEATWSTAPIIDCNDHCYLETPYNKKSLYIGIDIGSISSDVVVLDKADRIVFSDYRRTKGKPIETVRLQLIELFRQINFSDIMIMAATGSSARLLAKLLSIPFVNEVAAQATAVSTLYPHFSQATIIEMGGQDSKLIFISRENSRTRIRDFKLNTVCAAGTGSFLDQQAQRLGIDIENEFAQLAIQCKTVPRMAGRCSVFAKSDMIHLQQQATPICDIIAGLSLALARNLKSDLGCGRDFIKPIIFTGGVAANIGVVRAMEQVFELSQDELVVPDEHFFTGAIGSVLVAKTRTNGESNGQINLKNIDHYLSQRGHAIKNAPRRAPLGKPSLPPSEAVVCEYLLTQATKPIDVYLGVDVGSISTNVVIINEQKQLLTKAYLMTAGKPLEAVRQGLEIVGRKVIGKVNVLGAATTGSGRYLTGDFIGADVVINEITAQAMGTFIINPDVDTIFEIGGQDSKYISLENGVVVDFEMNHACAAGTGSFLEEQAQRLGININEEFASLAFSSQAPIKLGERCTVFMESDLLSYQQRGAQTSELVAGLSYSIVTNYLNRVVGRRKIGNNICFQGGTAFNKAVLAAFEQVTGKPIMVPDHHEVTGAIGAAVIAAERMKKINTKHGQKTKSSFKGFKNLTSVQYSVESFTCENCPNQCEIKKVQLPAAKPLYYGSRCDRYNVEKRTKNPKAFDAFEYRTKMLFKFAGINNEQKLKHHTAKSAYHKTIAIPMALINWQFLPMFCSFFKLLGFKVVISSQTNKRIIRLGIDLTTAQTCFPVKTAYGHIAELIEKQVDYIFVPSIVSMTASCPQNKNNHFCPYVESFVYQVKSVFADKLGQTEILTAQIRLGEGQRLLRKSFIDIGKKLNVSDSEVRRASTKAFCTQAAFEKVLKEKGSEILSRLAYDKKLFVLVSRPYNGCDGGLNLQLPKKLAELGVDAIPIDMLDLDKAKLGDELLHSSCYWTYGQKILRAAEIIKRDPRLFAIYLSNFSCGPDSFLLTFFKDIMAQKPCLQLELDEHSADAGLITRLEAFLESLRYYKHRPQKQRHSIKSIAPLKNCSHKRCLYIPYMGDCAYGIAASLRAYGQDAKVMPVGDEAALWAGRQFTNGKECLPCAITAGDMLKVLRTPGVDPKNVAFLMPTASGPCRFGMYHCMHRLILKYSGTTDAVIIAPDQDGSFYKNFAQSVNGANATTFMKNMWTAAVGIDLLAKLILRLRPFAEDPCEIHKIYNQSIERWVQAIENRCSFSEMCRLMDNIADVFAAAKMNNDIRKPRIGIVGEIYVRNHPFANNNIISRLEKLGAACDLAPVAEWIYYTNYIRRQTTHRKRQTGSLLINKARDYLQHRIEKKIAKPLENRFGKLAEEPVENVIEMAKPYILPSFEGEAILSVGKILEYYKQGTEGIINVMPFGCMPSTIVSTQTKRLSAACDDMPILNLSFDGQESSALTTKLEAFVEQLRQRQNDNLRVLEQLPRKHRLKS